MFPFQRISETTFKGKFAMNLRKLFSIFFITTVTLIIAFSANAQNNNVALEPIEVKALRTSVPVDRLSSSIVIITKDEIEKKQFRFVQDALRGVPGLTVQSSGPMGSSTSVFIRGAHNLGTAVLMDGIRMNLPTAGGYNFGNLTTDNVEKIEILRGPQSHIWGADSTGGVINIVTKKGKGKPTHSISFETGSFDTVKESLNSSGSISNYDYSSSLSRVDTRGFSSISKYRGNPENDGYENTTASARIGYNLPNDGRIEFVGRLERTHLEYDNLSGSDDPSFGNTLNYYYSTPFTKTIKAKKAYNGFVKSWDIKLIPTYGYREARDVYGSGRSLYYDKTGAIDLQNNLNVTNNLSFILGGEYKNQKGMGIGTDYTESMDNWAHYIHATYDYQDPGNAYKNILLMGGYRSDDHTSWGEEITYKFKVGYHLPKTNTSFHTSYATAFRAPSLDQLYSQSGGGAFSNSSLLPETSKNFEFGIKQKVNDRSSMTMTFFNSAFRNKIGNDSAWKPQNLAQAHSMGIETGINLGLPKNFNLALDHGWNNHWDNNNNDLIRVAKQTYRATLTHDWQEKLHSLVSVYYRGPATGSASNKHTIGFGTVRAAFGYQYDKKLKLTLRGENLLNERYEEKYQYGTAGISGYAGFTYTFN